MAKITIPFYCFLHTTVEFGQIIISSAQCPVSTAFLYQKTKELFYTATWCPYVLVPFDCLPEQYFQHVVHRNQTFEKNELTKGFALLPPSNDQTNSTRAQKEVSVYSRDFSCTETLSLNKNILWSQFVFVVFKLFFPSPENKHYDIEFYYDNGTISQKLGEFYPKRKLFDHFIFSKNTLIQVEFPTSEHKSKVINLYVPPKDKPKREDLLLSNKKLSDQVLELEKLLSRKEESIKELSESLKQQKNDHKKELFELQQQINSKELQLSGQKEMVGVLEEKLKKYKNDSKTNLLKCKKLINKKN